MSFPKSTEEFLITVKLTSEPPTTTVQFTSVYILMCVRKMTRDNRDNMSKILNVWSDQTLISN